MVIRYINGAQVLCIPADDIYQAHKIVARHEAQDADWESETQFGAVIEYHIEEDGKIVWESRDPNSG